jgi:hypothetical protein
MIQVAEKVIKITVDIEQPAGLVVKTELPPGDDFNDLLERSEPTGQRNETVGQGCHHRLARVH